MTALYQTDDRDSSVATGWTVRGSNPGGGEIFPPVQTGPAPTQPPVQWVPGLSRG